MSDRILFVDDEPNVLNGIRRGLRKKFDLATAEGPMIGLEMLDKEGPFAVVVSDMRMPEMNGAQFLHEVRERCPDSVRMVLSGESDLDAAISAVNDGSIFRFLRKPCVTEELAKVVDLALNQHRLIVAEKQLLERTLNGCVQVLTDVLGLANPEAFSRTRRIQGYVDALTDAVGVENPWEYRLAGLLSQIGCISLPGETVSKVNQGQPLSPVEAKMFAEHPAVASKLLENIPRLETVTRMVAGQNQPAVGISGAPLDWAPDVLGAQILRIVSEFDRHTVAGLAKGAAVKKLRADDAAVPAALIDALEKARLSSTADLVPKSLNVSELRSGMIFDADVVATSGILLAREGQNVTEAMLARLENFMMGVGIQEPLAVLAES